MQEFIAKLSFTEFLIMLGAVFVVIILPVLSIIFISKPYIKIGNNFLFGIGHRKFKPGESPHKSCPHRADLTNIVLKTIEVTTQTVKTESIEVCNIIEGYLEERLANIKSLLINSYSELLQAHIDNPQNVTSHIDYNTYSFVVEAMLRLIKRFIMSSVKQNNLEKKSDIELEIYIKTKFEYYYEKINEFEDSHYFGEKMVVSREELRDATDSVKDEIEEQCRKIFLEARRITIEKHDEVKKLWDKFYLYKEEVTGTSL